jgi:hypothetical protein
MVSGARPYSFTFHRCLHSKTFEFALKRHPFHLTPMDCIEITTLFGFVPSCQLHIVNSEAQRCA